MDTGTVNTAKWLNPELLIQFMDELRAAGYNIGIPQYIAVQDLLLHLSVQGISPNQDQLKSLIGPIVCCSPIDQIDFQKRFAQWVALVDKGQYAPPISAEQQAENLSKVLSTLKRRSNWFLKGLIATVTIMGVVLLFQSPTTIDESLPLGPDDPAPTTQKPISEEDPNTGPIEAPPVEEPISPGFNIRWLYLFLLLALPFSAWRIWWIWNAHAFLNRQGSNKIPKLKSLSMQDVATELFSSATMLKTAQQLRSRTRKQTNALDIASTIQASLKGGGWLTPVYGYRKVVPEYLFLIDRASHQDHQAKLVKEVIEQLKKNGVYSSSYYFDGDAQVLFSDDSAKAPQSLQEVAVRYQHDRLVIVAEGQKFYSRDSDEVEPWVEIIKTWKKRAILTPRPVGDWGHRELRLIQDFIVLPLSAEGMGTIAQIFNHGSAIYRFDDKAQSSFPGMLSVRPKRWLERNPPSPEEGRKMLTELVEYLGETGLYWLAACAAFPESHWNITVYLGNILRNSSGHSLIEDCEISQIARLPWLRYGYMPDWFRRSLLLSLTPEQNQAVRDAFHQLMVTTVKGTVGPLQLDIAQKYQSYLSNLSTPLLRLLSRQSPEDSFLRDYVFLDFMARKTSLSMAIPEEVSSLMEDKRYETESKYHREIARPSWKVTIAIGTIIALSIIGIRWIGILQGIELRAFDALMRLRPLETPDPRLVIITIDDEDIALQQNTTRRGSLSDEALLTLLNEIEPLNPRVIGLNIYRDYPARSVELRKKLSSMSNFLTICAYPSFTINSGIAPPPEVSENRVGFSDITVDPDGLVRRQLLAMTPKTTSPCTTTYSLSTLLALEYLSRNNIALQASSEGNFNFGEVILNPLEENTGGYRGIDSGGYQMLLNYRNVSLNQIADQITLRDVLQGQVPPAAISDRIVIIGTISPSFSVDTSFTPYGRTPGVFLQAQMTSQILSTVLDERPLLTSWPEWTEVIWITSWAMFGGFIGSYFRLSPKLCLYLILNEGIMLFACWLWLVRAAVWIPWVPSAIALPAAAFTVSSTTSSRKSKVASVIGPE